MCVELVDTQDLSSHLAFASVGSLLGRGGGSITQRQPGPTQQYSVRAGQPIKTIGREDNTSCRWSAKIAVRNLKKEVFDSLRLT